MSERGHHFQPRRDLIMHPGATRAMCSCGWKGRWHYNPSQPGKGEDGYTKAYREWSDHAAEAN